jgi:hypothetical protein
MMIWSTACAGSVVDSREPPRSPNDEEVARECNAIDSTRTTWGGINKVGGFLAGSGGIGTLATIDRDSKTAAYAFGTAALVGGVAAALGSFLFDAKDTKYKNWRDGACVKKDAAKH